MKKLFYLFMVMSCTLWSCSKSGNHIDEPDAPDNPDNPTNVTLEISTTDLVFEAKGEEKEFTIYCNADWTITNESDWCTTNITQGNGYGRVAVTVEAYSDTEDRNTNLTVKAGDKTEVLTVTQKHGDAIILSKDKFDVPQEGGEIAIEVKSNIEYQVSIPSKFQSWIKQTPESRAVTVKNFSFTVSANEAYEKREGYIVFSGNSLKDTVYVYQAQKNQLILTEDTYNIPSEGQDITVELKTNIDYEVTIQPNAATSWISQISARAIRTDKLNFHIEANTESNNRSAKIVIKDKNSDLSDTVQVSQAAKGMYAGDIVFETKQDLIDFHAAGHTKIMGNIIVKGNGIRTLQKLGNLLTEINGSLRLECSTLTSLDGLYGLKTITDSLIITKGSMTSFEGLQNLETIGGSLKVIASSKSLTALKSFQGLSSLKSIGGDFEVNASSYYSLTALESFEGLENLQTIGGSLKVIASSSKSSESSSKSLTALKSFQGLSSLKSIGGDFEVNASSSLTALASFEGLENLQTIGGSFKVIAKSESKSDEFESESLTALKSFQGLSSLKSIGGDFEVNAYSSSSLTALASFEGLENLQTIGGSFKVIAESGSYSLRALKSFQGLSSLKSIGGDFYCHKSIFTKGLSLLNSIGGDFDIYISSDEGLENLVSIGGSFRPYYGESFKTLRKLSSIGKDFDVHGFNGTSFEGLENLRTIGSDITIKNCQLNNIDALKNVESINDISITSCPKLYDFCVLKNIVQNMSGTFYVNGNGYNPTKYQLLNGECSKQPE